MKVQILYMIPILTFTKLINGMLSSRELQDNQGCLRLRWVARRLPLNMTNLFKEALVYFYLYEALKKDVVSLSAPAGYQRIRLLLQGVDFSRHQRCL